MPRAPRHAAAVLALVASPFVLAQTATPAPSRQLPETVVTAPRFAEDAMSLPLGVSVITADEIRASGATSVNEALIRVLGIPGKVDFYGVGDYGVDLRGFGATADSNQVVVLDGVRVSESDMGGTRLATIPIDSIERIEVIRGSGAVLYGEGATGGVIAITTKAGAGKGRTNSATAYLGGGSYGLRDARASATLAAGGFSLDAAAGRRASDGYRNGSRSELDSQSLGAQWSNDWLRAGATIAKEDLDAELPGALTRAQYNANPRQIGAFVDRAFLKGERINAFAQAELGSWQLAAEVGHRTRELKTVNGFFDYDIEADTQSIRARNESALFGFKNVLVVGADHSQWSRDILSFPATSEQRTRALYVKDDIFLATGTRLTAGLRSERIAKDDSTATANLNSRQRAWELGLSQTLAAQVTGYARIGRSFRLAKVDEFSFTNPTAIIQPQTSRDMELGARWAQGGSKLDARLYRSNITNEIGFDPASAGPFGPFGGANVNFDPTRRQGLEVDGVQRLNAAVALRLNAAVRRATFRSGPYSGRDVPLVPRTAVALHADWTPGGGHRVTGGANWVSSQYVDYLNTCSAPSYVTADLRYAYTFKNVELSLGASNLFDRKYFTQAFACAGNQATSLYPEQGRAVTTALRVSF
ncbi:MAG TPA: TonB-dependent receptor [Ramlibacter sp.]|nr:TonB-dependent receptor [Ramlibacter sp.]